MKSNFNVTIGLFCLFYLQFAWLTNGFCQQVKTSSKCLQEKATTAKTLTHSCLENDENATLLSFWDYQKQLVSPTLSDDISLGITYSHFDKGAVHYTVVAKDQNGQAIPANALYFKLGGDSAHFIPSSFGVLGQDFSAKYRIQDKNMLYIGMSSNDPTGNPDISGALCSGGCIIPVIPFSIIEAPTITPDHRYEPMTIPLQSAVLYQTDRSIVAMADASLTLWIRPNNYCLPNQNSSTYSPNYIQFFGIGNLQNRSSNSQAYSTFTLDNDLHISLRTGEAYPLKLITQVADNHPNFAQVWVDLDQSDSFEANELLYDANYTGRLLTGELTIPQEALAGETLMRVISKQNSAPVDACSDFQRGEVEDYLVKITKTKTIGKGKLKPETLPLKLTPNPSNGIVYFNIPDVQSTPVYIQVYTVTGQLAYTQILNPKDIPSLNTNLDLRHLHKGLYLIQVQTAHQRYEAKLLLTE